MATRGKKVVGLLKNLMDKPERIRNIGIIAHIDHGKTTLTDNLLAGAGIISKELAGEQLFTDFYYLEQQRGITIFSANVSMVHRFGGDEFLINLIDTPGHVDFGGGVTRALRAVDGAVVVVDAVEGIMPQTETVLRQALRENVKPVLFVNKVDRLINELKVDKKEMQMRLAKVIDGVNKMIKGMKPEKYDEWRLDATNGSVAFGSALYKWAISVPSMQKTGVGFNEVYDYCTQNEMAKLAELSPAHEVVLDMVVRHLPNPLEAQKIRIPVIWRGDVESEIGQSMLRCDRNGAVAMIVTGVTVDPHAGEVITGRLFSGMLRKGMELNVVGKHRKGRIQQVSVYIGEHRVEVDEICAGNIVALTGIKDAAVGDTLSTIEMMPFESIRHYSEPVVTVAVEAKSMKDLPRLIEILRKIAKEDPTVRIELNEETGEHLISGMGELHLEIITHRINVDENVPIIVSPPIVVYRETVQGTAGPVEGKSPNRHNRFYFVVEPLEPEVLSKIKEGAISMDLDDKMRRRRLEEAGMSKDEARGIVDIHEGNVLIDVTKGIQYLNETMELIIEGFKDVMDKGPLARERCLGIKVKLVDAKLHEDAIHRGPAQVIPAVRAAINAAILMARPILLEPIMEVFITAPQNLLGNVTRELQGRRGQILDIQMEGDMTTVKAKAPVAEMFGFAGDIRSATEGRALWSTEFAGFEPLPQAMFHDIVMKIRKRKGLKLEIPQPSDFVS
ncbi:elongation factor EF-2 [Candidatus Alkanophaga liquidiphilum]|nr:Translation elongation factor EF-G [Candidatus Alkanophaga liquidiphilum]RLG37591.1 MAG: elongation factor EF-2 [Candidatus Alkanophagales archaeon]